MKKLAKIDGGSKIGVLCSGGDAPGMNACIRAIVRRAYLERIEVVGIYRGYQGLVAADFGPLSLRGVGNVIQRGGTFLGSSRYSEFQKKSVRAQAFKQLDQLGIDRLIVLGGDGSMRGASLFAKENPVQVVGIPCSIDNDMRGSDYSVGFDTAVQNAVQSIDQVRDTADSHGRVFVVEVMGKNTGHIAVETGLAVGAEFVVIPEEKFRIADLEKKIKAGIRRGKTGSIVIVAEKKKPGHVLQISKKLEEKVSVDVRSLILGHLQRGGSPSAFDRNLASRFGSFAVEELLNKKNRVMTAIECQKLKSLGFEQVIGQKKTVKLKDLQLIDALSV